jgi:hypothetical protein
VRGFAVRRVMLPGPTPVMRRALAVLVAVAAVVVAAELPIRTHRFSQCLYVTSGGCGRTHYWGSPPWAIALAVVVGLAGLAVAFFLYQPRALQRTPLAQRLAIALLILGAAIGGAAALEGHRAERLRRPTSVDIFRPWWVHPTAAALCALAVVAAASVLLADRLRHH